MSDSSKRARSDSSWEAPAQVTYSNKLYHRQDLVGGDSSGKRSPWWAYSEKYCFLSSKNTITGWICKTDGCHAFIKITTEQANMAQRHVEQNHLPKRKKTDGVSVATSSQSETTEGSQPAIVFRNLVHTVRSLESTKAGATIVRQRVYCATEGRY